jgi:hypothetical protein
MAAELCGRGSVVEHHLAKVRVASSNLVARSDKSPGDRGFFDGTGFAALTSLFGPYRIRSKVPPGFAVVHSEIHFRRPGDRGAFGW